MLVQNGVEVLSEVVLGDKYSWFISGLEAIGVVGRPRAELGAPCTRSARRKSSARRQACARAGGKVPVLALRRRAQFCSAGEPVHGVVGERRPAVLRVDSQASGRSCSTWCCPGVSVAAAARLGDRGPFMPVRTS
jgi:hypothetical protein